MAGELVFITGVNGHIGLKVLVFALQKGYTVLAAVRGQDKADRILATPSIKALNPGTNLKFTIVPDLLVPGAYDNALKDAVYAIHIASPITSGLTEQEEYQTKLIVPALQGTTNFLTSALKAKNLKRAVITSSIVAQVPSEAVFGAESSVIFNEKSRLPDPTGPYPNEFAAYSASKIFALNFTERWVQEIKPHFSIVHVHPSFVLGADELVRNTDEFMAHGTNAVPFRQLLGEDSPFPIPGNTVLLDDTALAHVVALDESKVPNGQSLLTTSGGIPGTTWSDAVEVVNKFYPEAVKSGVLPSTGKMATQKIKIDASESERLLGYKFKSYEVQVKDLVDQYLELNGQAQA